MMPFEWLDYSVAVDGVTVADAHADRAHYCSEPELFDHIELVINSIEQPHGGGRLTPSDIIDREIEYSDRFRDGGIVRRDELLDFASDVGRYYQLSSSVRAPRFIEPIDPCDPRINIKATEIQRRIDAMIANHPSSRREGHWVQGNELLFAIGSVFMIAVVGVAMAIWFKYQS